MEQVTHLQLLQREGVIAGAECAAGCRVPAVRLLGGRGSDAEGKLLEGTHCAHQPRGVRLGQDDPDPIRASQGQEQPDVQETEEQGGDTPPIPKLHVYCPGSGTEVPQQKGPAGERNDLRIAVLRLQLLPHS